MKGMSGFSGITGNCLEDKLKSVPVDMQLSMLYNER